MPCCDMGPEQRDILPTTVTLRVDLSANDCQAGTAVIEVVSILKVGGDQL